MIQLEHVDASASGRPVLRDVSLTVPLGRRFALIGPSGCGKSTLLRVVLGMIPVTSGTVDVCGLRVTAQTARAARGRVGYVIQDGGLFPHLTAEQNVTLLARLRGADPDVTRTRVRALAELSRLDEKLLARYPGELSGGERQRVGLVRALMMDPEVLLLDEPLGALDPVVRAELQEDLRAAFVASPRAVILVTHDMAEAAVLAEEIGVMRDGRILQRGTMRELLNAPAHEFVAAFASAQRSLAEVLVG